MRIRAAIIDCAVLTLVMVSFSFCLLAGFGEWGSYAAHRWLVLAPLPALIALEAGYRTTWGMSSFRMRVVNSQGDQPTPMQLTARGCVKYSFAFTGRAAMLVDQPWSAILTTASITLLVLLALLLLTGVLRRGQAYYDRLLGLRVEESGRNSQQGFPVIHRPPE